MGKNKRQCNPIGLDLSGQGLRAIQLEDLGVGLQLIAMANDPEPIESEDDLWRRVDEATRRHGFVGRRIATALPAEALSIHHVQLSGNSDDNIADGVAQAVSSQLTYDVDEAVIRHLEVKPARGRDGQAEYVVFAAPRGAVEQHLRMAERLGLELAGVSTVPLAVGHAFGYLGQRREEADFAFLVVHLAPKATHLLIMQKGELRFARGIPMGVHDILDAAAKATGKPLTELLDEQDFQMRRHDDHLLLNSRLTEAPAAPQHAGALPYEQAGQPLQSYCEEFLSCLCYYSSAVGARGVDKVIFAGPQANDYDFCQVLANRLGLPAQVGDPFAGIQVPEAEGAAQAQAARPKPELSVAVGLSLYGAMAN